MTIMQDFVCTYSDMSENLVIRGKFAKLNNVRETHIKVKMEFTKINKCSLKSTFVSLRLNNKCKCILKWRLVGLCFLKLAYIKENAN